MEKLLSDCKILIISLLSITILTIGGATLQGATRNRAESAARPATSDGTRYAVVDISVNNMRSTPDFDAEMWSQALLGTPVHVVASSTKNDWYQIETPDNYKGWVHPVGIHIMSKDAYHAWNKAEKVVVTSLFGVVYSKPDRHSRTISDIVAGDRLKYLGRKGIFFKTEFPDGRIGYVLRSDSEILTKWRDEIRQTSTAIVSTAESMLGFPYIWAGMSPKGMDCSGFVRTTLFMHDIIIPRDAYQMAATGKRIMVESAGANLELGDLVFFGTKANESEGIKEHVSHVGIYIGNGRFIHSKGMVMISSLDPKSREFDPALLKKLLYASRILPYINVQDGLNTTKTNPYYNE